MNWKGDLQSPQDGTRITYCGDGWCSRAIPVRGFHDALSVSHSEVVVLLRIGYSIFDFLPVSVNDLVAFRLHILVLFVPSFLRMAQICLGSINSILPFSLGVVNRFLSTIDTVFSCFSSLVELRDDLIMDILENVLLEEASNKKSASEESVKLRFPRRLALSWKSNRSVNLTCLEKR